MKKIKYSIKAIFVLTVLLVLFLPSVTFAGEKGSNNHQFRSASGEAEVAAFPDRWLLKPNEMVTVNFALRNISDLYGASLDLKFDETVLQIVDLGDIKPGSEFAAAANSLIAPLPNDHNGDGISNLDDFNEKGLINFAWARTGNVSGLDLNDGDWHTFVSVTFKVREDTSFDEDNFIPVEFYFGSEIPLNGHKNGLGVVKLANSVEPEELGDNVIDYQSFDTTFFIYPPLGAGEYRAVVEWDPYPYPYRDIDAHMIVPQEQWKLDVSWLNEGDLKFFPYAEWIGDICSADDIYYSPVEVVNINIAQMISDGDYEFFVHDYDDEGFADVSPKVTIYDQNGVKDSFEFDQANQGIGNWWKVFTLDSSGEVTEENTLSDDAYGGLPVITNIMPRFLPTDSTFYLYLTAENINSIEDLAVEIYTYEENPKLITDLTIEEKKKYEDETWVKAVMDKDQGLALGNYIVLLRVSGQYSLPYVISVEDTTILGYEVFPPIQKAGISSFELTIPGLNLSGKSFSAELKDKDGNVFATSSAFAVEDSTGYSTKQLHLSMVASNALGIPEGQYYLEVMVDGVLLLDEWGDTYGAEIEFIEDPVFWGMNPTEFDADTMTSKPVTVYGWNVTGQEWTLTIFNDEGSPVTGYQEQLTAIESADGLEVLTGFYLPKLPAGEYRLEISNGSVNQSLYFDVESDEAPADLIITTESLPDAVVGQDYNVTLAASGGTEPYTWTLVEGSNLPSGLSLSSNGLITGIPVQAGSFSFNVLVTDSSTQGMSVPKALTLVVKDPTISSVNLVANSNIISPDGLVEVLVQVDNMVRLGGASLELAFDPNVLEVIDGSVAEGVQIFKGDVFKNPLVTLNEVDNVNGIIKYNVVVTDATQSYTGSGGILASISFRAKSNANTGQTSIMFNPNSDLAPNGLAVGGWSSDGQSVDFDLTPINVVNLNFVQGGVIKGKVIQEKVLAKDPEPLSDEANNRGIKISVFDPATKQELYSTLSMRNGDYAISGIPSGIYKITYFKEGWSKVERKDISVNSSQVTMLADLTLLIGDMNSDTYINVQDLLWMATAIGTKPGSLGWKDAANVNKDNYINVQDLLRVAVNIGKRPK